MRRHAIRSTLVPVGLAAALAAGVVLLAPPAGAQEESQDLRDQVVLTGRLVVPEGETVDTAVIFNGPALIEGTVRQTLVVFNGRVEITGSVEEDVISFNGRVFVRAGGSVGGDVMSRRGTQVDDGGTVTGDLEGVWTRFDGVRWWVVSRFVWWFGYSMSTLVLGFVLLAFARRLDERGAGALRGQLGEVAGFGGLAFLLLPIVAVLLFVLVVTIPLGVFLLLALGFLYTVGYTVAAIALGRRFLPPPRSRAVAFFAGWGVLRLLALIPVVGGLTWLAATIVGLGVLWVVARSRPREAEPALAAPGALAPPPPPPAPA
jgi:hypothetical protein